MSENKSTEGQPMYVESLMTPLEWRERMKKFKTSLTYEEAHKEKPNPFKWRKGMGANVSQAEMNAINNGLDALLKKAGIKQNS